jgi:SAM-dependent methyltransferase
MLAGMNRMGRRANLSRMTREAAHGATSSSARLSIDELYAAALDRQRNNDRSAAQELCRAILTRNPKHVPALVLLGGISQQLGRNNAAVKVLLEAIALEPDHAAAHDNLATAYQALNRRDDAVRHFTQAISLGLRDVETLVKQSPVVAGPLQRLVGAWPRKLSLAELFGPNGAGPVANEALLLSLLQSKVVCDLDLERFLTALRRAVLENVTANGPQASPDGTLGLFCALAQQCFINEYVFAVSDSERAEAQSLRHRVAEALKTGAEIAPLDLAAVATYGPLHALPAAASILSRPWPDALAGLLAQQVREPMEEAADREAIPALTTVDDAVSMTVQSQYEENPYPRWTARPRAQATTIDDYLRAHLCAASPVQTGIPADADILVAGCGTGAHSIETALRFPQSRVLAIDISRASLAYARRKTRDAGVGNIDYAQADILKLGAIGRRFDIIESVGVLHHLSDPLRGWRVLASLLRPRGLILVGLYSAAGRRAVNAARAYIAERGYRATADDIRTCRQDLINRGLAIASSDFCSTSGCRDLCFNVVEHQFTIPQIAAFLAANQLTFLCFEVTPAVRSQFDRQFPDPAALSDLTSWQSFEELHPRTFAGMYNFWVCNGKDPKLKK